MLRPEGNPLYFPRKPGFPRADFSNDIKSKLLRLQEEVKNPEIPPALRNR